MNAIHGLSLLAAVYGLSVSEESLSPLEVQSALYGVRESVCLYIGEKLHEDVTTTGACDIFTWLYLTEFELNKSKDVVDLCSSC